MVVLQGAVNVLTQQLASAQASLSEAQSRADAEARDLKQLLEEAQHKSETTARAVCAAHEALERQARRHIAALSELRDHPSMLSSDLSLSRDPSTGHSTTGHCMGARSMRPSMLLLHSQLRTGHSMHPNVLFDDAIASAASSDTDTADLDQQGDTAAAAKAFMAAAAKANAPEEARAPDYGSACGNCHQPATPEQQQPSRKGSRLKKSSSFVVAWMGNCEYEQGMKGKKGQMGEGGGKG